MKIRNTILLSALVAVILVSCKKEDHDDTPTQYVKKVGYSVRSMDVNVNNTSYRIDVPFLFVSVGSTLGTDQSNPIGDVCYDLTDAIENVHYVFPKTDKMTRYTDSTYAFPIKIYPDRITEPMTITMVHPRELNSILEPAIDTITINLIPTDGN